MRKCRGEKGKKKGEKKKGGKNGKKEEKIEGNEFWAKNIRKISRLKWKIWNREWNGQRKTLTS